MNVSWMGLTYNEEIYEDDLSPMWNISIISWIKDLNYGTSIRLIRRIND